jgi:hypothetical protein
MSRLLRFSLTLAAVALAAALALAQRSGDMRDPDLRHDEGWTTLFDGKTFGKMVVILQRVPRAKSSSISMTAWTNSQRFPFAMA